MDMMTRRIIIVSDLLESLEEERHSTKSETRPGLNSRLDGGHGKGWS
jgi:hypothetical protein